MHHFWRTVLTESFVIIKSAKALLCAVSLSGGVGDFQLYLVFGFGQGDGFQK